MNDLDLRVRPLAYALGAEIRGIDLREPMSRATAAQIRGIWLDNLLICLPGQQLEPDHLLPFAEAFGPVDNNDRAPYYRLPGYDKVLVLGNVPVSGKQPDRYRNGQDWHSDLSHTNHPATGTFLFCRECPDVGGETMFANMYAAYEHLSPAMREMLDPLEGVHDLSYTRGAEKRDPAKLEAVMRLNPPIAHPIVRVHPETGRKALFVNQRVRRFEGMTEEESAPLLAFLNEHSTRHEFIYRKRWTVGDVLVWDNRCIAHIAIGDYDVQGDRRQMIRCALEGPQSGHLATA